MTGRIPAPVASAVGGRGAITIRRARATDGTALRRIAALTDRPLPDEPLLVAEVEGEVIAASPAAGGDVLADPFRVTIDIAELLHLRSRQLRAAA